MCDPRQITVVKLTKHRPLWLSGAVVVKAATSKEVVLHHALSQQKEDEHKCDYEKEPYHFTPRRQS
jgi:hypothetical protein